MLSKVVATVDNKGIGMIDIDDKLDKFPGLFTLARASNHRRRS